ncbi:TetR family transcriptional regulator [Nocardioides sp. CFH 31398]|uniref:TetR family transcriptional regulator n=1 Tax=Nocardioides sp. CFH 31398 TaxID=2919579 RepID=UPI001F05D6D4|nr:TetR family transcriptional regulator [Nocardioides sp. CFH 31398]MCH1868037.1 TetR family transcriptional regulator [Nocardioides sp. CFH 31398]
MAADRTKYRIAETAMRLFLEQGYENVTVEAVASASEVSRRTVFRYFGGKDELPFPDHSGRLELLRSALDGAAPGTDPVEAVIAATRVSLRDFLSHPELVLRRYQLTRLVPELRTREVVEHERYVVVTRAYLRANLPDGSPPYLHMAWAQLIDAMHRAALGDWVRSGGATDAEADLEAGFAWIRRLVRTEAGGAGAGGPASLLAVLPDSPEARAALASLRDASHPL